jgi:hypothetical protein
MLNQQQRGTLQIPERCLAFFIDDTGHEQLKVQSVYGLGGCAVLGRDFTRVLDQPWRSVRQFVAGSPNAQLHANTFSRKAEAEDFEAVARFFRVQPFWRFAAVVTERTILANEVSLMATMRGTLLNRIEAIVGTTMCEEVRLVFESSQRVNKLIEATFQDFDLRRGEKSIPWEGSFMPKSAEAPALEVADFVMHAVGRQARTNSSAQQTMLPDFDAVFAAVEPRLRSYMEVGKVTVNG